MCGLFRRAVEKRGCNADAQPCGIFRLIELPDVKKMRN
jgi:hypothetical protein